MSKWIIEMVKEKKTKEINKEEKTKKARIITLMQFARKAGKLIYGMDACIRAINHRQVYLILMTSDYSLNSSKKIFMVIQEQKLTIHIIKLFSMKEISDALGLPLTGVFGITDKGFADRIHEYDQAENQVEETCQLEYMN